jgi:mRNA interferase MazF
MDISRADVWLVNLDPTVADEIRKTRPAAVVSDDAIGVLALRVVVPITAWQDRFGPWDWMVKISPQSTNGLEKLSAVDARSKCDPFPASASCDGRLSEEEMDRVSTALRLVLDL